MDAGEKVPCGFFVARCDGTEVLDDVEETLDEIALGVEGKVAWTRDLAIGFGRDDRPDPAHAEMVDEAVAVVGLVSDHRRRLDLLRQRHGLGEVVSLTAGEAHDQRVAERIDDGVDLGCQSAARAPDRLVRSPLFRAPALC